MWVIGATVRGASGHYCLRRARTVYHSGLAEEKETL